MLSLITFLIVLSVLILVHEFGHFIFAKKFGVKVETFSLGFGNKLFSFKRKGTEYCISSIPLGGYVKMAGETPYDESVKGAKYEFVSKTVFQRAVVLCAGPVFNYILGFLLFVFIFITGNPQITSSVGRVLDGYPAKAVGIMPGDRIIELNGKKVRYYDEILDIVQKSTQGDISVKVKRNEKDISFTIKPKIDEFKNILGQNVRIGRLGVKPSGEREYVKYGPVEATKLAAQKTWDLTTMTYVSLWRLMTGAMSFKESVTGPIGIFMVTSKAAYEGFAYVIGLMAILSISLGIFNILPIPVLDGGHLLFLVIEKIRGKVVSEKIYERVTQVGMALLGTLMIFVIYNDIVRAGWIEKIMKLFIKQ